MSEYPPSADDNHLRQIRKRRRSALVLVVLGIVGIVLLYAMPPSSGIYPPCMLYRTTGWHCPGCGATRCLYALLHGRIAEAASYNILFFLLLPMIGYLVGRSLLAALSGADRRWRPWPSWIIIVLAVVLLAYGIVRNINCPPFDRLAPGRLFEGRGVRDEERERNTRFSRLLSLTSRPSSVFLLPQKRDNHAFSSRTADQRRRSGGRRRPAQ